MTYDFEREMGIEQRLEAQRVANEHHPQCPECNSWDVVTVFANAKLHEYDRDMPFHKCEACGLGYTDFCFEDAADASPALPEKP